VRVGGLATSVAAIELVRPDGTAVTLRRGDPTFAGSVVSLGALGVVTHLTLELVPPFDVAQYVHEGLTLESVCADLDEILASAYSVSVFTDWSTAQVWQKFSGAPSPSAPHSPALSAPPWPPSPSQSWSGGRLAPVDRH